MEDRPDMNKEFGEHIEELDENILNTKNACVETEQMLGDVAHMDEISDHDDHLNSQPVRHSPTQHTSSSYTQKSSRLYPANTATHKTSSYSVQVRRSSNPSNNPSIDHLPQPDDPFTGPPSEIVSTSTRYTTASTICDTLSHALAFFTSKEGRSSPFDHLEDTNTSSKVEEIILLGQGFEGASASSTLERKERIVDQRKVVDEQVYFVHEHVRSYRLETVLNLAGSEILDQIKVGEHGTANQKEAKADLADGIMDGEVRMRPNRWEDQPVMFQKDAEWSRTTPVRERSGQQGMEQVQGSGQGLVEQPADSTRLPTGQEDQGANQQLYNNQVPIVHTENLAKGVEASYPVIQLANQLEPANFAQSHSAHMDQSPDEQVFSQKAQLEQLRYPSKPMEAHVEGKVGLQVPVNYREKEVEEIEEIKHLQSIDFTGFVADKEDPKSKKQLVNKKTLVVFSGDSVQELREVHSEYIYPHRQLLADSTEFSTDQDPSPSRQDHFEEGPNPEKSAEAQQIQPAVTGGPAHKPRSESIQSIGSGTSMGSSEGTVVTVIELPVSHFGKEFDDNISRLEQKPAELTTAATTQMTHLDTEIDQAPLSAVQRFYLTKIEKPVVKEGDQELEEVELGGYEVSERPEKKLSVELRTEKRHVEKISNMEFKPMVRPEQLLYEDSSQDQSSSLAVEQKPLELWSTDEPRNPDFAQTEEADGAVPWQISAVTEQEVPEAVKRLLESPNQVNKTDAHGSSQSSSSGKIKRMAENLDERVLSEVQKPEKFFKQSERSEGTSKTKKLADKFQQAALEQQIQPKPGDTKTTEEVGKIEKMAARFEEIADSQVYEVMSREKEVRKLPLEIFKPQPDSQLTEPQDEYAEEIPKIEVEKSEIKSPTYQKSSQHQNVNLEEAIPELPAESPMRMTEQFDSNVLATPETKGTVTPAPTGYVEAPDPTWKHQLLESEHGILLTKMPQDLAEKFGLEDPDEDTVRTAIAVQELNSKQSIANNEQVENLEQAEDLPYQTLPNKSTQFQEKQSLEICEPESRVKSAGFKGAQPKLVDESESSGLQELESAFLSDRTSNLFPSKEKIPVDQVSKPAALESHPKNSPREKVGKVCQSEDLPQPPLVSTSSTPEKVKKMMEQQQQATATPQPFSVTKQGAENTGKIKKMTEKLEKQPTDMVKPMDSTKTTEEDKIRKMAERFEEIAASRGYEVLARTKELKNLLLEISSLTTGEPRALYMDQQKAVESEQEKPLAQMPQDLFSVNLTDKFKLKVQAEQQVEEIPTTTATAYLHQENPKNLTVTSRDQDKIFQLSSEDPDMQLVGKDDEEETSQKHAQKPVDPSEQNTQNKVKEMAQQLVEFSIPEYKSNWREEYKGEGENITKMAQRFEEIAAGQQYEVLVRGKELKNLSLEICKTGPHPQLAQYQSKQPGVELVIKSGKPSSDQQSSHPATTVYYQQTEHESKADSAQEPDVPSNNPAIHVQQQAPEFQQQVLLTKMPHEELAVQLEEIFGTQEPRMHVTTAYKKVEKIPQQSKATKMDVPEQQYQNILASENPEKIGRINQLVEQGTTRSQPLYPSRRVTESPKRIEKFAENSEEQPQVEPIKFKGTKETPDKSREMVGNFEKISSGQQPETLTQQKDLRNMPLNVQTPELTGFEDSIELDPEHFEPSGRAPTIQPVEIMSQIDLLSEVTYLQQSLVKLQHRELEEPQNPGESGPDWITQLVMQGIPDTSSQAEPQKRLDRHSTDISLKTGDTQPQPIDPTDQQQASTSEKIDSKQPNEILSRQKELKNQTIEYSGPGIHGQPAGLADQQHIQAQEKPSGQTTSSTEPDNALAIRIRQERIRILEEQRLQMVYEVEESTHRKRVKRKPTQEKTSSQSDSEHSCSEEDYTDEDEVQEKQLTEMPLLSTIQVIQRQISRQEEVIKRSESQTEDARFRALMVLPYQTDLEHRPLSALQALQAKNRDREAQQENVEQASNTAKIRKMTKLVEQQKATGKTSQPFESTMSEKKESLLQKQKEAGKIKMMAVKFEEIAGIQQYEVLAREKELKKLPLVFARAEDVQSGHLAEHEPHYRKEIQVEFEPEEEAIIGQQTKGQPEEVVIGNIQAQIEPEVEVISEQKDELVAEFSSKEPGEDIEHQEILQEQDLSDSSEYSDDSILPKELDTLVQSIVRSRSRPESSGTSSSRFGTKTLKEEPLSAGGDLKVEELRKSQELDYKPLSAIQVFHANQRAEHEKRLAKKQKNTTSGDLEGSKGKVKKTAEELELSERPSGVAEMAHDSLTWKAIEKNAEEGIKIKKMAEKFEEIAGSQAYEVLARDKELRKLPLHISTDAEIEVSQPKLTTAKTTAVSTDYRLQEEAVQSQKEVPLAQMPEKSLPENLAEQFELEVPARTHDEEIATTTVTDYLLRVEENPKKMESIASALRAIPVRKLSLDHSTTIIEQVEMLKQAEDLPYQTLPNKSTQLQEKEVLEWYEPEMHLKNERPELVDESEHSEMQALEKASPPDSTSSLHTKSLSNVVLKEEIPVDHAVELEDLESHPSLRGEVGELCQSEDLLQLPIVSSSFISDGTEENKVKRMVVQQEETTTALKPLDSSRQGSEYTGKIKKMTEKLEKQPTDMVKPMDSTKTTEGDKIRKMAERFEEIAASRGYEVLVRGKELKHVPLDVSKPEVIKQLGVFEGEQPDKMVKQVETKTSLTPERLIATNTPAPTLQETTEQQVSHEVPNSFLEQLSEKFDLEGNAGTQISVASESNDPKSQELEVEKPVAASTMTRRNDEVLSQSEDLLHQSLSEISQEHQTTQQRIDPMADTVQKMAEKFEEQTIEEVQTIKSTETGKVSSKISEMARKFEEIASSLEHDMISREKELKILPLEISKPEPLGLEEEHPEETLRVKKETSQPPLTSSNSEVLVHQTSTQQQEVLESEVIAPEMSSEPYPDPFGLEKKTEIGYLEQKSSRSSENVETLSKSEDLPYQNINKPAGQLADPTKINSGINELGEKLEEQASEEVQSMLPVSSLEQAGNVSKMTKNPEEISASQQQYDVLASSKGLKKGQKEELPMEISEPQEDKTAREVDDKVHIEEIRSEYSVKKVAEPQPRPNQEKDSQLAGQQKHKPIAEAELRRQKGNTERSGPAQKGMQTQPEILSYSSEELTQQPITNILQRQDPIPHKQSAQTASDDASTEIKPVEEQEEEQGIKLVTSFEPDVASKVTGIWKVAERYEEVNPEEQSLSITAFDKDLFKVPTSQDSHAKSDSRAVRPLFGKSLSSINEAEEGDERQMQMSPNQLLKPTVMILLWLEPELEMDYVELDKSGWTNQTNEQKLAVDEENDHPGDSSSSSFSHESLSGMSQSTFVKYAVGTPESLEGTNREDLLSFDEEFVGEHVEQMEQSASQSPSAKPLLEQPPAINSQKVAPEMFNTAIQTYHEQPEQILEDLPLLNVKSSQTPQGLEQPQNPGTSQDPAASTQVTNTFPDRTANQPPAQADSQQQNSLSSLDIVAGQLKYEETSIQTLSPSSILYHDVEKPGTDLELLSQNVTITLSSQLSLHPALVDVQSGLFESPQQTYPRENRADKAREVKKAGDLQHFVRVVEETTEIEEYITVERIACGNDSQNADPAKPSASGYTTSQIQTMEQPMEHSTSRTRHLAERQLPKTSPHQQTNQSAHSDPNAQWHKNTAVQTFSDNPYTESRVQAQKPEPIEHQQQPPFRKSLDPDLSNLEYTSTGVQTASNSTEVQAQTLGYMTDLDRLHMLFHQHEPVEYQECPGILSKSQMTHSSVQTSPNLLTRKFSQESIDTKPKNISDNELERVRHTLKAIRNIIHSPIESEEKKLVETHESSVLQAVLESQERSSQIVDLVFSSEPDSLGSQSGAIAMKMQKRKMDMEQREMEKASKHVWSPLVVTEKVESGADLESKGLQDVLDMQSSSQTGLSRARTLELQQKEAEHQWSSRKAIKYKSDDKLRALKRFSDPGFSPKPALLASQSGVQSLETQQEDLENLTKVSEHHWSPFIVNQGLDAPKHQLDYREVIEAELRVLRQRPEDARQISQEQERETDEELLAGEFPETTEDTSEISYYPHERSANLENMQKSENYPPEPLMRINEDEEEIDLNSHQTPLQYHRYQDSAIQMPDFRPDGQQKSPKPPLSSVKSGREDQLRIIKHSLDAVQRRFVSPEPEILEEGDLSSTHGSEKPFHHVSTVQFAPMTRSILAEEPHSEPENPTNDNQRLVRDVKEAKKLLGTIRKRSENPEIQENYSHLSVQTEFAEAEDVQLPRRLVKVASLPEYRPVSPVFLMDLERMSLMSPVSMQLHIFEQYLVDEDWCMPYFLVPKEHELLGHTKWPLIQRCIPEWLEAAAEVLLRSVRGESVVDSDQLRNFLRQIRAERESAALTRNYCKATEEVLLSPPTSPAFVKSAIKTEPIRRFNQYLDEDEYMWQEGDAENRTLFEYDASFTGQSTGPFEHDLETEEDDDEPEELMLSSGDEQEEVEAGEALTQMWTKRLDLDQQENAKINAFKYLIIRQDQASIYLSEITTDLTIQPQDYDSKPLQEDDPDKTSHPNQPEVVFSPTQAEFLLLQRHPKPTKEAPAAVNLLKDVQLRPVIPRLATKPARPASKSAAAEELAEVLAGRLQRLSQLELEQETEDQKSGPKQVDYAGAGERLLVEGVNKPPKEAVEKRLSPFGARKSFLPGLQVRVSEDELSEEDLAEIFGGTQPKNDGSQMEERGGTQTISTGERTQPIKLGGQAPQVFVEQELLVASKTSLKPVKHTTTKRSAVFSQDKEGPASDSDFDLEDSPYIQRASKLFKRLDQEFVKSRDQPAQLGVAPIYTVRFARLATLTIVGSRQHNLAMPELFDGLQQANGGQHGGVYLNDQEETDHSKKWDPTGLLANKLYKIDYNPLVEKRNRYRTMEGHLEVPNEEKNLVPEIEKDWKKLYFRVKDGRFQWFANHCADEHPIEDVLLTGTTITPNKDEWTLEVKGGKENANITVRTPSNLFEKWHQALLSHSNSKLIDAYVQPVYPPVPHYTQKVVLIELGTCSIRAGLLTNKPSLPQTFFPAIGCVTDAGEVFVGIDAFKPEIRCQGRLESPIQAAEHKNLLERYKLNKQVLEACLRKVLADLRVDPAHYKVLLSIPQNIPTVFIGDLLKTLLHELRFKAASIARQPSLILYSYDVTSGVVVDIGDRLNIVPVIDEYIVENAIISLPFGAQQIRDSLKKKLGESNNGIVSFNSAVEQIFLRHIVEQSCYVATDYEEESKKSSSNSEVEVSLDKFNIGPGMENKFIVDSARFHATEGLFKPKRWNLEIKGIHQLIHDAIQQSPIDSRRTLYRNIYLTGGTSLLPGLAERLETELCKVAPTSIFVQVHGSPWRYNSSYLGSQVIANSLQFENCCADLNNLDDYIKQIEAVN